MYGKGQQPGGFKVKKAIGISTHKKNNLCNVVFGEELSRIAETNISQFKNQLLAEAIGKEEDRHYSKIGLKNIKEGQLTNERPYDRREKFYQLISEISVLFNSDINIPEPGELKRSTPLKDAVFIKYPKDILPLISFIAGKKQEYLLCISLNGGEVMANRIITIGLADHTLIHPREVFVGAISDGATSIIIAHNHISNQTKPSSGDIDATRQVVDSGKIIGITVLDHIIITKKGYFSFKEEGLM